MNPQDEAKLREELYEEFGKTVATLKVASQITNPAVQKYLLDSIPPHRRDLLDCAVAVGGRDLLGL